MTALRRCGPSVVLLISASFLVLSSVLAGEVGNPELEKYAEAQKFYDAGKYDDAKPIFEELKTKDLGFWKNRSVRNYLAAIDKKQAEGEAPAEEKKAEEKTAVEEKPAADPEVEKKAAEEKAKADAEKAKADAEKAKADAEKAKADAEAVVAAQKAADELAKKEAAKKLAEKNYDEAVTLYNAGKYAEAKALLDTLKDMKLGFFKDRKVKTMLAAIQKKQGQAVEDVEDAAAKEKGEAEKTAAQAKAAGEKDKLTADYEEGARLYSAGKYPEAKAIFQRLKSENLGWSRNRRVRNYLSGIEKLEAQERVAAAKAAEEDAGKAIEDAGSLLQEGKLDEAERLLVALSEKDLGSARNKQVLEYLDTVREKRQAAAAAAAAAEGGAAAVEPEPEPLKPEPPADPVLRRAYEILEQEKSITKIKDQRDEFLAQHHINVGKAYYKRFEYKLAREEFRKALDLDRRSDEALLYLEKCNTMLDIRKGRIREYARREFEIRTAEVEKARIEMRRLYEEGQQLLEAKKFDDAMAKFHAVREIIHWMPFREDVSEYDRGTQELITQATEEKAKWKEEMDLLKAEEASVKLKQEIEAERMYKKQRIRMLMIQAKEFQRLEKYEKAIDIYDEILRLEPELFMANVRKTGCQRMLLQKRRVDIGRKKKLAVEEGWIESKELSEPQTETLRMPSDWDIIRSRTTPTFGGTREVPEWQKAIEETLDSRRISFFFQETQLTKVLSFLADLTGLDFIPKLDEGLDPPVTLRVNRMALRNALDWIATLTGTKWAVDRQAIYFGARVIVKPELRFYPIKDIMFQVVDYAGPSLQITTDEDEGFELPDAAMEPTVIQPETVIQYIQNIDADSWVDPNKIEYHAGMLLVINAPEVHEKIAELLSHFRSTRGLQVSINSQFIELTDNFLEDLGIDWRGLTGRPINEVVVTGGTDAGVLGPTGEDTDWRLRIQNQPDTSVGRNQSNTGGLGLSVAILDDIQVKMILHAVQKKSKGDVLVAPKLTCFDGQRAHVLVADQTAYIAGYEVEPGAAGGAVGATPRIRRTMDGVVLDVRPIVSADRKFITLEVHPSLSRVRSFSQLDVAVGGGATVPIQLPLASIKMVHTTVMIPDGGTILIGGLMDREETRHNISVPFLSKIPILNNFFRKKAESIEKRNLVILMRGKILDLSGGGLEGAF